MILNLIHNMKIKTEKNKVIQKLIFILKNKLPMKA